MTARDLNILPGSIPGLLRRGSPVRLGDRHGVVAESPDGCASALVAFEPDEDDEPGALSCVSLARLSLDITDATGRAHAAWWLERATRGVPDHMATSCGPLLLDDDARDRARAHIRHLDPYDDTRLPDGSRVVDALALRAIVLDAAGVAS